MAVTEMITYGHGRKRLGEEMAKCEVLCANCHRVEHHGNGRDEKRQHLRAWLDEHKATAGCSRCAESDPRCLVFHHVDDKRASISELVANCRPRDEIEAELQRCVVLCANCHRKEHFEPPDRERTAGERLRQS